MRTRILVVVASLLVPLIPNGPSGIAAASVSPLVIPDEIGRVTTTAVSPGAHHPRFALQATTERVLVSIPGHRTSEFMAATNPADPNHLVAVGIDWDHERGLWTCAAFVSRDGGITWSGGPVIPRVDGHIQGDPWVSIDRSGVAHFVCLDVIARDEGNGRIMYSRSDDGGSTWEEPIQIAPRNDTHTVDRTGIVAGKNGSVVACTNEYDLQDGYGSALFDGVSVAYSDDGGRSWSRTQQVTKTYSACRAAATGLKGETYIAFAGLDSEGGQRLAVVVSPDGGRHWSKRRWTDVETYFGSMAVSPRTGHVFLASGAPDGGQVHFVGSKNQGRSFETIDVPELPTECASCTYVLQSIVSANSEGDLGLLVQVGDREPLGPITTALNKEVWLLVSRDEGKTWLEPLRVAATDATQSFLNPLTFTPGVAALLGHVQGSTPQPTAATTHAYGSVGPVQRSDHLLNGGDYWGMTTSGETFVPMWLDHFNGIPQIWASRVELVGEAQAR